MFAAVAVVSGRPLEFLIRQLALDEQPRPIELFGQYGLQHRLVDGTVVGPPLGHQYALAVDAALAVARDRAPAGVIVEAKGIALTLHWRLAPQERTASITLARDLAERFGLFLREGKMAAELVPDAAQDKGAAIRSVFTDRTAGCVLGDDFGDIPAFRAARQLTREREFDAVLVAVIGAEVPPELRELADLRVERPEGALSFLRALADAAEYT